ncbi:MAG: 3'-5' exonuclease, partial [Alphaproteobacteria bacterium]
NPDQWAIIRGLTKPFYDGTDVHRTDVRTSFVVGDLKQSIYGFQRADPQVFQAMKKEFEADVSRADGHWIPKNLNVTFRSAQPVLDAVNHVFEHGDNAQGLTFDDEPWPTHQSGRAEAGGLVEVWDRIEAPANSKEEEEQQKLVRDEDDLDDEDRPEVELAKILGQRISDWTNEQARPGDAGWLENHNRPMKPSDIMVLVRSRSGPFIPTLTQTLKKNNVAVAGADRLTLTDQLVVQDLMVLVEYLLQPADDLALATILRSPLIGFTETQLYDLAHPRPKGETLDTALAKAANGGVTHAVAAQSFFNTLRGTLASPPYAFFTNLLSALGGAEKISERLGPQASDTVKEFLRAALTYERANTPTLPGFLGWMRQADIQVKREQDGENAGVRIMTVHGSKGLEAPVVILPHSQRRTDDITRDRLRWYEHGETPIPYWKPNSKATPYQIVDLEDQDKQRAMEEERRLLYVAMTRAEERLYICGWKTKKSKDQKDDQPAQPALTWYDTVVEGLKDKPGVLTLEPQEGLEAQPVLRLSKAAVKPDRAGKGSGVKAASAKVDPEIMARLKAPIPPEPSPP